MKYPIGIQTFSEIINGDYVYVDKTSLVYDMVSNGKYYFLSRPRRFGKSLLLSTIEAYFKGQKELFEGLEIYGLEKEWSSYPVLHFDLNNGHYDREDGANAKLSDSLAQYEALYGKHPSSEDTAFRFEWLIKKIFRDTGRKVVILVDEYDKPMLEAIGDEKRQESFRQQMKPFFGSLKTCDQYIKFAMLTGVTKYGHLSIFSDLNNLNDISMAPHYAAICGITERELRRDLVVPTQEFAQKQQMSPEQTIDTLRLWYDGYRFSDEDIKVYNPYSLLSALQTQQIKNYWFRTGTPTLLMRLLKGHNVDIAKIENIHVDSSMLVSVDSAYSSPIPILYQSGYLTIKHYDPESDLYTLNYPNREVQQSFMMFVLPYCSNIPKEDTAFEIDRFVQDIRNGDINSFFNRLNSLLADLPYSPHKRYEHSFQDILYVIFTLLGFRASVEKHISTGRIDCVVSTDKYIYVMEFKVDGNAVDALRQIEERGYAQPFEADPRQLIKIGVNFNTATRSIDPLAIVYDGK